MKKSNITKISCALLSMTLLVGCGANNQKNSAKGQNSNNEISLKMENEKKKKLELYNSYLNIIKNAAKYKYETEVDEYSKITGYYYTLVNIKGIDSPVLLLSRAVNGVQDVTAFYYDNGIKHASGFFQIGASARGRFRGEVYLSKDNSFMYLDQIDGMFGQVSKVTLKGGKLITTKMSEYKGDDTPKVVTDNSKEIMWSTIYNRAFLEKYLDLDKNDINKICEETISNAKKNGLITIEGTVRFLNKEQLLAIQNSPDPEPNNNSSFNRYAVLLPTKKEKYTFMSADSNTYTNELDIFSLGKTGSFYPMETWQLIDGKKVVIVVDKNKVMWPSDASLPLGAPSGQMLDVVLK